MLDVCVGLQGVTALLDPDLHERMDSLGWNHQEDHIPLLSQNIRYAASGCRNGHPYHTKHDGSQEYNHNPKVHESSGQ